MDNNPLAFRPFRRPLRRMMTATLAVAAFLRLSGALPVSGQQITIRSALPELFRIKLTNGFFVVSGRDGSPIKVLDRNGSLVATIDVLASFPQFREASIQDVSVQPNRAIVMATVLANRQKKDVETKANLLYYDWRGALTQAVSLDPSRSIDLLQVDEDGSVWALLDGAGDADRRKSPVIAVFKGDRIIKSFLNWSYFPHHAYSIDQGPKAKGSPAFGITRERVWFWLPGYDVFSFDRDGGNLTRLPMRLPKAKGALPGFAHYYEPLVRADRCVMLDDDRFMVFVQSRAVNVEPGLYILNKKGMSRYPIDREDALGGTWLLGLDNPDLVFVREDVSRKEFQIFWKHPE